MTFTTTPTPDVRLAGLGIGGYRSMPDLRLFSDLGKVTLLAGQNNVGKSNVIRFLDRYLRGSAQIREWEDEPRLGGEPLRLAVAYRLDEQAYAGWVGNERRRIDPFLDLPPFHLTGGDLIWVVHSQTLTSGVPAGRRRQSVGDSTRSGLLSSSPLRLEE